MSIERGLELEPYSKLDDMECRVLAFPREVLLGIWDALLTTPPEQLTAIAESVLPRITAPLLSLHGSQPPPDYEGWLTSLVPSARASRCGMGAATCSILLTLRGLRHVFGRCSRTCLPSETSFPTDSGEAYF